MRNVTQIPGTWNITIFEGFFPTVMKGIRSHALRSRTATNMADDGESLESWLSKLRLNLFFPSVVQLKGVLMNTPSYNTLKLILLGKKWQKHQTKLSLNSRISIDIP